jgi:hypothetical protein
MSLRGRLALLITTVVTLFGMSMPVMAQQDQTQKRGSGLSISPTRYDLQVAPGKTDVVKITLRNISGTDIVAKAVVNDFESDGETGEPRILTDKTKQIPQTIRNFLVDVGDVPLKKDENKTFDVNVKVPDNAAPGAYYGVIRYEAVPQTSNGATDGSVNVSLTASVGVVVLLTVPGTIQQQLQTLSVRAFPSTTSRNSSSFFIKTPGAVGITLKNLGNGFATPFGTVNVTNMFGKQVYSYQLNTGEPRGVILPNSTRVFKDNIKGIKMPGRYTITANTSYGNGGEIVIAKGTFWYVPVWLIVLLVVLLSVIVAAAYVLYRRLSRRPSLRRRK